MENATTTKIEIFGSYVTKTSEQHKKQYSLGEGGAGVVWNCYVNPFLVDGFRRLMLENNLSDKLNKIRADYLSFDKNEVSDDDKNNLKDMLDLAADNYIDDDFHTNEDRQKRYEEIREAVYEHVGTNQTELEELNLNEFSSETMWCAVKKLNIPPGFGPEQRGISKRRFEDEIKIMKYLGDHKNIGTIVGDGKEYTVVEQWDDGERDYQEENSWFAMKYYKDIKYKECDEAEYGPKTEDEKDAKKPKKIPIPIPDAVNYIIQTLEGLTYGHERKKIHRDIKPDNLLVVEEDGKVVVKICDFGIAKDLDPETRADYTQVGDPLGTAIYQSPEQLIQVLNSEIPQATVRWDMYSTGATLYEFITGEAPLKGNYMALGVNYMYNTNKDYTEIMPFVGEDDREPSISNALEKIIMMMLAKKPENRLSTYEALHLLNEIVEKGLYTKEDEKNYYSEQHPVDNTLAEKLEELGDNEILKELEVGNGSSGLRDELEEVTNLEKAEAYSDSSGLRDELEEVTNLQKAEAYSDSSGLRDELKDVTNLQKAEAYSDSSGLRDELKDVTNLQKAEAYSDYGLTSLPPRINLDSTEIDSVINPSNNCEESIRNAIRSAKRDGNAIIDESSYEDLAESSEGYIEAINKTIELIVQNVQPYYEDLKLVNERIEARIRAFENAIAYYETHAKKEIDANWSIDDIDYENYEEFGENAVDYGDIGDTANFSIKNIEDRVRLLTKRIKLERWRAGRYDRIKLDEEKKINELESTRAKLKNERRKLERLHKPI